MTINEAISFLNILKQRISELSQMRERVSVKETYHLSDNQTKIIEPQYDVKALDKKIIRLQNWVYKIDAKIKETNAKTQLDLIIPEEELLEPLA